MKRLRATLAVIFACLVIAVALIVARALQSITFEREMRHRAIAERAFDEMELALSRFLEREEGRSFMDASLLASGRGERARESESPLVAAYFQLDPDGTLHLHPTRGAGSSDAKLQADYAQRIRDALQALEREEPELDADFRVTRDEGAAKTATLAPSRPREPTARIGAAETQTLDRDSLTPKDLSKKKEQLADDEVPDAYEVLTSLNRASQARMARKQKTATANAERGAEERVAMNVGETRRQRIERASEPYLAAPVPPPESEPHSEDRASARSDGQLLEGRAMRPGSSERAPPPRTAPEPTWRSDTEEASSVERAVAGAQGTSGREGLEDADLAPEATEERIEQADAWQGIGSKGTRRHRTGAAPSTVEPFVAARTKTAEMDPRLGGDPMASARSRVTIDPMVGRAAGDDHLLIYRTSLVEDVGYRQGVLIETPQLARWLEEEVLAPTELARLSRAHFGEVGESLQSSEYRGDFLYVHRFGEPFDRMQVVLDLDPLPGLASARSILLLAVIAILVTIAGFVAVHRMVSVVVEFAERRNDFVAAVSHELKTPLTSIRMYGEMLRDGLVASPEKRDEYYRNITGESERLSRLIDNVLEFSRSEKDNRARSPHVGDLGVAVEEAADKLAPHIEREGFALRTSIDEDLPAVRFDRDALLQVLFNLVDNALKYARSAPTREIVIECRRNGDEVDLAVRDFGPGVSSAQNGRIFEPFHRGDTEATQATGGAGIGLALVKDLAEGMGAAIGGDNAEGGGYRVCLSFPVGQA